MKRNIFRYTLAALSSVILALSCVRETAPDYDGSYGYVQFKLYKEASYTKATQLEYLADACKIGVTMYYGDETISQTLVLNSADRQSAEFGLRSDKLKLLAGDYSIITFTLYDSLDRELYTAVPAKADFSVTRGGLSVKDLTVNVTPRGSVNFSFTKDLSGFHETKSVSRQYTFDEIGYVDITVANTVTNERFSFEKLKTRFSIHFDEDKDIFGYQTSSLTTLDTLSIKAGEYSVVSYNTYTSSKTLLERNTAPAKMSFKVVDNAHCDAKVPVTLYESDEYIKDYYALYEIWKALDGPNWFFRGQDFNRGSNWDFNKDPDLWGDQPGVQIYPNGRIAMINLEGYNFKGSLPAAIGQLTELDQLYLGNHNDISFIPDQPGQASSDARIARHKRNMASMHPATPLSEPIARALLEHEIVIPETSMYQTMSEDEVIDRGTGRSKLQSVLMDNPHGVYSNGLTGIDPAIGKLSKLEYLYIANCPITSLPEEMSQLSALTDFELYNCPQLKEFPMSICNMPSLISVNLSNNYQWSAEEILKGVKGLANGPSGDKIQIMYLAQNNLEELPLEVSKFRSMGLFDASFNKISKAAPFGHEINLVDCYLDNNLLTDLGRDEQGFFCGIEDVETFSATNNLFTQFPDIFSSKSKFIMATVDFSYNRIERFEGEAEGTNKGIMVQTLTLANNPITTFPTVFAKTGSVVSYINMRGCRLENIPEDAFKGDTMLNMTSLDLSYNHLSSLPEKSFNSVYLPYLYGLDISYNRFSAFPWSALDSAYLTVLAIRGQRNAEGNRCFREWPTGIYQHKGLRGLYLGSNDLRKIVDTISTLIYVLDISDNPNITFDATDICYAWRAGAFMLVYDKSQNIINCDYMLQ